MITKYAVLFCLFLSPAASALSQTEAESTSQSVACNAGETLLMGSGHSPLRCREGGAAEAEAYAMDDLQNNAFCEFAGRCNGEATLRTDLASDGNWHFGIIGCNAQQYGCAKCTPKASEPKQDMEEIEE